MLLHNSQIAAFAGAATPKPEKPTNTSNMDV
jgi:hypothetical protein